MAENIARIDVPLMTGCNNEAMGTHLEEIAFHVAPGARSVLLLDQARWDG